MGLFIRRLFWFILVLASGFVAVLLAGKQYGFIIDLNAWAKISGLHEISGADVVINKIPVLLDHPVIKSSGFYGSLVSMGGECYLVSNDSFFCRGNHWLFIFA